MKADSSTTVFLAFSLKNSSVAEFFVELANQLDKRYQVVIFSHAIEDNNLKLNKDIEVLKWPSPRPTHFADLVFLARMIRKYHPQIMISNFAAVNLFLGLGFLFKVPQRIAWYHTLYEQLEKNRLLKFRKRFVYKLATRLIANSRASKNDLIENFGVKASKISVVYNALKGEEFSGIGSRDKIIFAGRLDAVKGVSILIRAMANVVHEFPQLVLHIIGDDITGNEAERLKEMVKELSLEKYIIFRGNKSRNAVLEELSTAWFSVVPSRVEAFGYVVIESFSVGTPVIGSDTTGISEIIRNGKDGFLFKVGDDHDLAEKMITVLKQPELRNEMSGNCKKRFEEKFELSASVEQVLKILE